MIFTMIRKAWPLLIQLAPFSIEMHSSKINIDKSAFSVDRDNIISVIQSNWKFEISLNARSFVRSFNRSQRHFGQTNSDIIFWDLMATSIINGKTGSQEKDTVRTRRNVNDNIGVNYINFQRQMLHLYVHVSDCGRTHGCPLYWIVVIKKLWM